jgi:hypothetical protein
MKQLTKKQMKKLKGKVNEMDYNLSQLTNSTTVPLPPSSDSQNSVCKQAAILSDH